MILGTEENYTLMNFIIHTLSDIVRVLKSRTLGVVVCVTCMGDLNSTTFWEQVTG